MLNREKYAKEIIELAAGKFGLKNGKPVLCTETKCIDCDFCEKSINACKGNTYHFREWLNSEYVEPPVDWSKVPVDTPIWVRNNEAQIWVPRYFAKYENGKVYAWREGATSWSIAGKLNAASWEYAKLVENDDAEVENPQTNADRIRSMTDEELLDFLCSIKTYEQNSAMTIEGSVAMCSVTDVEQWLKAESEG